MELVYLWVEEYKNIKNQGFNFSLKFECKYDKDIHELVINEKKEYVNIFPENINVTAIVGENGSGKSSILESLSDVLSENFSKWLQEESLRKYVVIYKHDSKYIYLIKHIDAINIVDQGGQPIDWIEKNPNSWLLEWHNDILTLILQNEVKPNVIFKEDKQVFVEQIQAVDKNRVKKYIVMNTINSACFKDESKKFFNPNEIFIKIRWQNLFNKKNDSDRYDEEVIKEIQSKIDKAKQSFRDKKYKDCFLAVFDICNIKQTKLKKPIPFFTVQTRYMSNYFEAEKNYSCLSKVIANYSIKDVHQNIINKLDEFENMTIEIGKLNNKILDFIFDLPEFIFEIEIRENDKSFDDLSFGERQLLTQLNCILFYANQKQYIQYEGIDYINDEDGEEHEINIQYEKKVQSVLVLLDEFEIGLHPNWQKKSINYVIDFLQDIKHISFNLVITSHSPFILSDLPKENVLFLKDGKQVEVDIDTFGANIHTLLSHGFFMEDGLMGEFAKDKINDVISYLNGKTSEITNHKEAQNIISIIGEPIIKKELQKMLKNKMELSNKDEIDKIKDEIKTLTQKLEKLEKKDEQ